ncbi:MAG: type III pantothenate kinase [Halothiobacillaceae bacterium]
MKLLLDVGNTRIKWRMGSAEGRITHTQENWSNDLAETWKMLAAPSRVFVGSVASAKLNLSIAQCVKQLWRLEIIKLQSQAECCGVRIQYADPQRFGVDRFAALVAARAEFPDRPLMVLDAGTAITLDVLDASGLHQGGVIMPGLHGLSASLERSTAMLPKVGAWHRASERVLQHDTLGAIQSGTRCMFLGGLVFAIQQALKKTANAEIVLCGGDQSLLQTELPALLDAHLHGRISLVLDGLEVMSQKIDDD